MAQKLEEKGSMVR